MWRHLGIAAAVVFLSGIVYLPVLQNDYVALDDELLIVDNVKAQGLTWENMKQAFTTYDPELYIPLTLLTYQAEYSLVGRWNPAVSHGISLVLHLLNVLLVYWLMRLLLRNFQFSIFNSQLTPFVVALLWAVHPLNVEAVAWAAARKDLLSAFFFLLAVILYLRSRESSSSAPHPITYTLSLLSFFLGLLAKVAIAPLPLVLFLLEWFWDKQPRTTNKCPQNNQEFPSNFQFSIFNFQLVPFFLLSLVFGVIALLGKESQVRALGATLLAPFLAIPFYLQKLLWPTGLSILYPFTEDLTLFHPAVLWGIAVVCGVTAALWWSTRHPAARGGVRWGFSCTWLWFLLLLAPSFLSVAKSSDSGIVDLYIASDRYAYLAMLGPLLFLGTLLVRRSWLSLAGIPIVILFAFFTTRQIGVWHDSEALFRNVLIQHLSSHIAANNLAGFLARKGEKGEAMELYRQSLTMRENPRALFNLGRLLIAEKRYSEALPLFARYVALKPRDGFGQMQLGGLYLLRGDTGQARPHLEKAVTLDANLAEAHYLLGVAYERLGDRARARAEFQETLRHKPDHPHARGKIGEFPPPAGEG